ncbi:hypothetical protein QQX98_004364 [Neonectria punicea]|uniref:FAD-binding domain-containing protein n=1 Tax=Neonectria punicea TaxID=979145 RepID=A0ABR1HA00_9HYPO
MPLNVAIIGSGLCGLATAISLRRQGHYVTLYERYDFSGEVGSNISCASNGTRFLEQWGVDIQRARPVILKDMVRHDWSTGEITSKYPFGDYKGKFGTHYYSFHRVDIHSELKRTATTQEGQGPPAKLLLNHKAIDIDAETGWVKFENGLEITANLVIAADGIRSTLRAAIGVETHATPSTSCCYRCIVPIDTLKQLGLTEFVTREAIEYWGGMGIEKIVMSPAAGGNMICCYCFYPSSYNDLCEDGWNFSATPEQLVETFKTIDPTVKKLFGQAEDIKMWRLYDHKPYSYWVKGKVALAGDSAHPMMPDQSQGAVSAFEDAAALGLLLSEMNLLSLSVEEALKRYEALRKPRATMLQAASLRARLDLTERIGWSSANNKPGKLTIEDVAGYKMEKDIATRWPDLTVNVIGRA